MKTIKNIKYFALILGGSLLLSACNDFIEEDIYTQITSENFIDESTADQLIVGLYTSTRSVYQNYGYKFEGTDIFTTQGEFFRLQVPMIMLVLTRRKLMGFGVQTTM